MQVLFALYCIKAKAQYCGTWRNSRERQEVSRLAAVTVAVPVRMRSEIEFEGWITGVGDLLPLWRESVTAAIEPQFPCK